MKKTKKILIVDDSPTARAFNIDFFKGLGFLIFEAENGSEAIKIAQKELPDIILSDVLMPVLDGFGLCIELKKHQKTCDIPVILLSGTYIQREDKEFGIATGAHAYLRKPLPQDKIKGIIANIFRDTPAVKTDRQQQIHQQQLSEYQSSIHKKYNSLLIKKMETQVEKYNTHQQQLEKLLHFATNIQEIMDDDDFLDKVLETIAKYTDANAYSLYIKPHNSPDLYLEKSVNVPEFFRESLSTVEIGYSFAGKAFAQEKILEFITDEFTSTTMKAIYLKHKIKKITALPLISNEGIKGSIVLLFQDDKPISSSQLKILNSMAKITGHSISRKKLDLLIKESRRKYRNVFDHTKDSVYAVDKNFKITSINKKLASQYDSFPGKIAGKICYEVLQGKNSPCETCPVNNNLDHSILDFKSKEYLLRKTGMPDENGIINNYLIHLLEVNEIKNLLQ